MEVAGGFEKKFELLESLQPDVAIVPEACDEARLLKAGIDRFSSMTSDHAPLVIDLAICRRAGAALVSRLPATPRSPSSSYEPSARALLINIATGLTAWWIMTTLGGRPRSPADAMDAAPETWPGSDDAPSNPDQTPADGDPGPTVAPTPTSSASVTAPAKPRVDGQLTD